MTTTVVVPTFDHGPLLAVSVGSALSQTVEDLEVLVVGDGVTDATRDVAHSLERQDRRVRFLDLPKGPRAGEIHRDAVLREQATGDVVCYLSDDDLWLDDHVAVMRGLLQHADFAHALPTWTDPSGATHVLPLDLARPALRSLLLEGATRIPLSAGAHTRAAYLKLEVGWQVPPAGMPGDLFLWRQFLEADRFRVASSFVRTLVGLPSPHRREMTLDERHVELAGWAARITEPSWRAQYLEELLADAAKLAAGQEADGLTASRAYQVERAHREAQDAVIGDLEATLLEMRSTRTWRWRARVLEVPGGARAARMLSGVVPGTRRRSRP